MVVIIAHQLLISRLRYTSLQALYLEILIGWLVQVTIREQIERLVVYFLKVFAHNSLLLAAQLP